MEWVHEATDYATFYWLCDVFIDPVYRNQGLGKFLIGCVVQAPELQGYSRLPRFLSTSSRRDTDGSGWRGDEPK
ncbi:MAG: GNAT family N-acetyltransferase [Anaerolineaceae bacterium]|nr:GNAT family N-acetyltransferase [Anaerolineaceae bacterium]